MIRGLIKRIIPRFAIGWYHFSVAFFGALVYGFPSRAIKVIGITGTNGKTTTANLTTIILEEAGFKVAVASSIKFKIGPEEKENRLKMTMPGRAVLQKFLRDAVMAKCDYAIIEATSEGVLQHRHRFINWQIMVFTNLSAEHIERHNGFENYKKAKGAYFKKCKNIHIINRDDANAEYFLHFPSKEKFCYGLKIANSNFQTIKAENVREERGEIYFDVQGENFCLPLIGKFNLYNSLAAICVGLSQGVLLEVCQKALAKAGGVPGRMEEVISSPFRVIVDYAFTPNALEQVYSTLRLPTTPEAIPSGCYGAGNYPRSNPFGMLRGRQLLTKLICVLGACGGGRDKWKRPVLGQIAAKYCDEIIVTNEDPYDENPLAIIEDVANGFSQIPNPKSQIPKKILDRREAIRKALELAKSGDTVVITGKGCEPWICVENNKKIPWDDRQVVREEFKKITNHQKTL